MSSAYLRKLELGEGKRPGIAVLLALASALGVSTDGLITGAEGVGAKLLPEELAEVYQLLGWPEREAWLTMGKALVEVRRAQQGQRNDERS